MSVAFVISLVYGVLQAVYGIIARKKHSAKVLLWLGLAAAVVIILSTLVFIFQNFDKRLTFNEYNFFGWNIVGYAALAMALLTGIMWLVKKKLWPNGIFFVLNAAFLVLWWLTRFYYHK